MPSAGVHTFSVYGREDGTPVDRIVITQGAGSVSKLVKLLADRGLT